MKELYNYEEQAAAEIEYIHALEALNIRLHREMRECSNNELGDAQIHGNAIKCSMHPQVSYDRAGQTQEDRVCVQTLQSMEVGNLGKDGIHHGGRDVLKDGSGGWRRWVPSGK